MVRLLQCHQRWGLIQPGEVFQVRVSAYGLALFEEKSLPGFTAHPIVPIKPDGTVQNRHFHALPRNNPENQSPQLQSPNELQPGLQLLP
jgi:hypothetical protein